MMDMDERLQKCVGGAVPPIATPLDDSGAVDQGSLRALRDWLVRGGVSGVFALGSTGEASYLTDGQRQQVASELGRASKEDGLPLFVGVVEPTAARVIEALGTLPLEGAAALVVTGPFYASASASEIISHFRMIAQASPVPLLAYNIPVNVGYALPPLLIQELIADGVIAGVKDSAGDLKAFRQMVGPEGDAAYFSGSDGTLDLALDAGANGSVAGLGNVAPGLFVRALTAHAAGDRAGLAAAQGHLARLTGLYAIADPGAGLNSTQLGSIKTALMLQGVIESDRLSAPMRGSSAAKREQVRVLLAELGLLA
jgi:4-hydroxy-tetrahydrodipicolinate synthase